MNLQRMRPAGVSYDLRMKRISPWLLMVLVARGVTAQPLQVVPELRPEAVFGGMSQNVKVQFQNAGPQPFEAEVRMILLQTSTATAVWSGEWAWKKLLVWPGQTVLETATVSLPAVRAETHFLLQWSGGASNILGRTEVVVYPTNLLARLKSLAGDDPLGVFDPDDQLKALLRTQGVEFQDLREKGTDKFSGKLAIFGPFASKSQMRASLRDEVRALAKRGVAVVWLQPPAEKFAPLKPSFYVVREAGGAVVVAASDLVAQLAERPRAQLNLLRLAEEASQPTPMNLPETEISH